MPIFSTNDLEICPSEYINSCDQKEINQILDHLIMVGYIKEEQITSKTYGVRRPNIMDEEFWNNLEYLKRCRDLLSVEDEQYIKNLVKKYEGIRR